ncbi:hypothetical protein LptCag_1486 [Leptospirillum ferriphilum]|uniref:Uncharacterized protein n=1 Tax=Leptospirillum ferriphilum TaxID=178606 RepID=A0A094YKM1_9BACT|nr:hypothetical protein LptCag_1486 [Leptospirillum ferriphilum]
MGWFYEKAGILRKNIEGGRTDRLSGRGLLDFKRSQIKKNGTER